MKADLTRVTFNPLKQFSGVLMQQGRVQLDADWNEQGAILTHQLRRLAADLFGPAGGPAGNLGFAILPLDGKLPAHPADFAIGPGRYYVDGIACDLDATWVAVTAAGDDLVQLPAGQSWTIDGRMLGKSEYLVLADLDPASSIAQAMAKITDIDYAKRTLTLANAKDFFDKKPKLPHLRRFATYLSQPSLPHPPELTAGLAYLDVWEQAVTYVEDDSIREVALNGPDTAARSKVVWQVRILPREDECVPPQDLAERLQPTGRGRLRAQAKPAAGPSDPCTISPDARYRGMENQLYRVEVHTGNLIGNAAPTFKWSRENGAVLFAVVSGCGTNRLTLESLGRDDRFGLAIGDWVEVEDDAAVLANRVTPLLQVRAIDRSRRAVTLSGKTPGDIGTDAALHPRLRRWDHSFPEGEVRLKQGADNAVEIPASGTEWLELEDGVQVQFVDTANARYRTGDYWLIPARVATGDVEWPRETVPGNPPSVVPIARLPDGIIHHYAPLAVIAVSGSNVSVAPGCRMVLNLPMKKETRAVAGGL